MRLELQATSKGNLCFRKSIQRSQRLAQLEVNLWGGEGSERYCKSLVSVPERTVVQLA